MRRKNYIEICRRKYSKSYIITLKLLILCRQAKAKSRSGRSSIWQDWSVLCYWFFIIIISVTGPLKSGILPYPLPTGWWLTSVVQACLIHSTHQSFLRLFSYSYLFWVLEGKWISARQATWRNVGNYRKKIRLQCLK